MTSLFAKKLDRRQALSVVITGKGTAAQARSVYLLLLIWAPQLTPQRVFTLAAAIRLFRRAHGVTPTAWRARYRHGTGGEDPPEA